MMENDTRLRRVHPSEIVVFLGPTLCVDEAAALLPAIYLPPARCGDILMARRLKPKAIALIDGLFERNAAVWHKEILAVLEAGILVYGAASMGALRAAELESFGMSGVGEVFEKYRRGVYTDDDEVAVAHHGADLGFRPVSDAMANVRATVARALRKRILSAGEARLVLRRAKETFYADRHLHEILSRSPGVAGNGSGIKALLASLANDGYVDQKRLDAIALLRRLGRLRIPSDSAPRARWMHRSVFYRKLHGETACRAFPVVHPAFPWAEKIATEAACRERNFPLLQRLGTFLALARALSRSEPCPGDAGRKMETDFPIWAEIQNPGWARDNDLEGPEVEAFRERAGRVICWVLCEEARMSRPEPLRRRYSAYLLRIYGDYRGHKAMRPEEKYSLYRTAARLWTAIDHAALRAGLGPDGHRLQRFSDDFRKSRGLERASDSLRWLREHDLNLRSYREFLAAYDRMTFLCDSFNVQVLGVSGCMEEEVCWLHEALRFSGFYAALRARLDGERM